MQTDMNGSVSPEQQRPGYNQAGFSVEMDPVRRTMFKRFWTIAEALGSLELSPEVRRMMAAKQAEAQVSALAETPQIAVSKVEPALHQPETPQVSPEQIALPTPGSIDEIRHYIDSLQTSTAPSVEDLSRGA